MDISATPNHLPTAPSFGVQSGIKILLIIRKIYDVIDGIFHVFEVSGLKNICRNTTLNEGYQALSEQRTHFQIRWVVYENY